MDQVFVSRTSLPFSYIGSVALANPASATAYSPAPSGAPLFNNGQPSYLDMEQGQTGDCWLDASLAEVAARDPQEIKDMFVYDGTTVDNGSTVGLYSVRFYTPKGVGFFVQVDTSLPSGGSYYDQVSTALGTQSLWTALAEKGYAEANALGLVTTSNENQGSYAALNGGSPTNALPAITGHPAGFATINYLNPASLSTAWTAGQLIVLGTSTPSSSYIVANHDYAVVGYNQSNGQALLFNPWGTQSNNFAPNTSNTKSGLFSMSSLIMTQNFNEEDMGSCTASAPVLAGLVDEPTETDTLDHAGPEKFAVVHLNDHSYTAFNHIRPVVGMKTVGGPLS